VEVVASLSQGRTAAAQCGLFTQKSVPVIFEPPCTMYIKNTSNNGQFIRNVHAFLQRCFTLLVCLNWSWQPKCVWCKLLLLRTVNCRPTTFRSTTALQSTAKYCNSKATTFIFWRFPLQIHTGYQRSGRIEGFLSPTMRMLRYFQIKPRSDPSLRSTNNGFPTTSMLYNTFSWNKVTT